MTEIRADLIGDSRSFVKSVEKGSEAVEDLNDELRDVGKTGDKELDGLTDKLRELPKVAKKAGDGVEDGLTKGFKEAGKEAADSGKEAAQSFSGSFEDVAGFLQETLAQAFSGFGPIGAAAGVAIAAALGAALQGAADAQEKLELARERAAELAQTLYENKGKLPVEDAISRVLELLPSERGAGNPLESFVNQWVDLGTNIDAVRNAARRADSPMRTFVRGLSGADLDDTAEALEAVDRALAQIKDEVEGGALSLELGAQKSQLESLKSQLEGVQTSSQLAREALGAVGSSFESADYVAKVESIGQAWADAQVDATDYVDVIEGVTSFDWSTYLANAEATLAAANEFKRKIVTLPPDIQEEAHAIFAEQGAVAANAYITAYESVSQADKQRFIAAARQNGEAAGQAQGEAIAKEAELAAQALAQGWGPLSMKIKPDDSAIRSYRPPTIDIPARLFVGGRTVMY